jgi:transcriptional regulator with XRE-family HTH domain
MVGLDDQNSSQKGLSQADVAELAGVSLNWYELFESGRGDRRVSVAFVARIAQALRLNEGGRLELFRLALPEYDAVLQIGQNLADEVLATIGTIRTFSRLAASAGDFRAVATLVAETLQAARKPDVATIVTIEDDRRIDGLAYGPRADHVSEAWHRTFWRFYRELPPDRVGIVTCGPMIEELLNRPVDMVIHETDGDEIVPFTSWRWTPNLYRETGYQLQARSSLTLPLVAAGKVRGLAGMFWTTPRDFSRLEIETARALAAIVPLIATDPHGRR